MNLPFPARPSTIHKKMNLLKKLILTGTAHQRLTERLDKDSLAPAHISHEVIKTALNTTRHETDTNALRFGDDSGTHFRNTVCPIDQSQQDLQPISTTGQAIYGTSNQIARDKFHPRDQTVEDWLKGNEDPEGD